jgi:small subunit ribosomal protein S20e
MAAVAKKAPVSAEEVGTLQRIRITLTSTNVKAVESVCSAFKSNAKDLGLKSYGPVRLPSKVLRITTRKAPSGQGTQTFDALEMRLHKRILDVESPAAVVKKITSVVIEPGVDVVLSAL